MTTAPWRGNIDIRAVRRADVPGVVSLVRDTLAEFGLRFGDGSKTDQELMRLPDSYDREGGAFWVAVDEEGWVLGTCGVFPVAPGDFELRKMYLHPDARGQRLGKRLLETSIAWSVAHDGRRLVLDTTEQMTRAIAFYEANGFVRDDGQLRGSRCSRGYARRL